MNKEIREDFYKRRRANPFLDFLGINKNICTIHYESGFVDLYCLVCKKALCYWCNFIRDTKYFSYFYCLPCGNRLYFLEELEALERQQYDEE